MESVVISGREVDDEEPELVVRIELGHVVFPIRGLSSRRLAELDSDGCVVCRVRDGVGCVVLLILLWQGRVLHLGRSPFAHERREGVRDIVDVGEMLVIHHLGLLFLPEPQSRRPLQPFPRPLSTRLALARLGGRVRLRLGRLGRGDAEEIPQAGRCRFGEWRTGDLLPFADGRALRTEQGLKRVRQTLDLFDSLAHNLAVVQHPSVRRRHLAHKVRTAQV
jgi:hypothetical protein